MRHRGAQPSTLHGGELLPVQVVKKGGCGSQQVPQKLIEGWRLGNRLFQQPSYLKHWAGIICFSLTGGPDCGYEGGVEAMEGYPVGQSASGRLAWIRDQRAEG